MFEKWFNDLVTRFGRLTDKTGKFRIRYNIIGIVGLYVTFILLAQIAYGLFNIYSIRNANERRDKETISHYLSQATLDVDGELNQVKNKSSLLYDESFFYFTQSNNQDDVDVNINELNTIIDIIFKTSDDITGFSIYRKRGGMISYINPYSQYYYLSGAESRYLELIDQDEKDHRFVATVGDNLSQSMLSVAYFKDSEAEGENTIIAVEKNWGSSESYFEQLGLLDRGSVIMINEDGQIIMSFRQTNTFGHDSIVKTADFIDNFEETSGNIPVTFENSEKIVFYDKIPNHGCTLIYVTDEAYFSSQPLGLFYVTVIASLLLLMMNLLVFYLFRRNVYRPITNMESALHSIVNGETNLDLADVTTGNQLYPMYDDLNSLTDRLSQLIASEYSAGVMKKQAEIDALQSQINPHFLYNTLESIRGEAMEEGVDGIARMVKALADIFRYSITNQNKMVTLEEELKNIDNYLDIQQYRFNNRFNVVKEIDEASKKTLIPKLIIQPLVENAIKHGLELMSEKGTIKIKTTMTDDSVIVNIEDNGLGMDKETLEQINISLAEGVGRRKRGKVRVGLGLININERIKLIFNVDFGLKIFSMKDVGTNAELRIPKITK